MHRIMFIDISLVNYYN